MMRAGKQFFLIFLGVAILHLKGAEASPFDPQKDYYQILGLSPSASPDEIKAAYRKLARAHHPDLFQNAEPEEQKKHEAQFKDAAEAYEVLSDPEKLAGYLEVRSGRGSAHHAHATSAPYSTSAAITPQNFASVLSQEGWYQKVVYEIARLRPDVQSAYREIRKSGEKSRRPLFSWEFFVAGTVGLAGKAPILGADVMNFIQDVPVPCCCVSLSTACLIGAASVPIGRHFRRDTVFKNQSNFAYGVLDAARVDVNHLRPFHGVFLHDVFMIYQDSYEDPDRLNNDLISFGEAQPLFGMGLLYRALSQNEEDILQRLLESNPDYWERILTRLDREMMDMTISLPVALRNAHIIQSVQFRLRLAEAHSNFKGSLAARFKSGCRNIASSAVSAVQSFWK